MGVVDADPQRRPAVGHSPFDLAQRIGRSVGVDGEDQERELRVADRAHDGRGIVRARLHVAGGYPATDAVRLQQRADGCGCFCILGRVAHEDLVRQWAPSLLPTRLLSR